MAERDAGQSLQAVIPFIASRLYQDLHSAFAPVHKPALPFAFAVTRLERRQATFRYSLDVH